MKINNSLPALHRIAILETVEPPPLKREGFLATGHVRSELS